MIVKVEVKPRFVSTLVLLGLVVVAFAGMGWAGYVGDLSEAYLTPPFSPYSYVIGRYNSTHYFLQNGTGFGYSQYEGYEYMSNNASKLIHFAWNNLTSGGTVFWKAGTYTVANTPTIQYSNIMNIGEGDTTIISFSVASACFKITSASNLDSIGFRDMKFEGNDIAARCIDSSGVASGIRVRWFTLENCRVEDFTYCAFDMKNPELQRFEGNDFYDNGVSIRLWNQGAYSHGNIFVYDNFFGFLHNGEIGIKLESAVNSETGENFVSQANHYYADATELPYVQGVYLNCSADEFSTISMIGDRTENMGLFNGTIDASTKAYGIKIIGCEIVPAVYASRNSYVGITLPLRSRGSIVSNNNFRLGNGVTGIIDLATSTSYFNEITDNSFIENSGSTYAGCINGSVSTYAHDNVYNGFTVYRQIPEGVKSTYNRNGNFITYYGTSTNGWVSETAYTIQTCDIFLTISGGTVTDITIKDQQGNTYISGVTTLTREYIHWKYTVTITFSVVPTLAIFFTG